MFRGMFAIALWDNLEKKLILARDPFGIKPLYYTHKNNIFYFASQIKSLANIENVSTEKNPNSINDYFVWGHIQGTKTLYRDINSLEIGSIKIIKIDGEEKKY